LDQFRLTLTHSKGKGVWNLSFGKFKNNLLNFVFWPFFLPRPPISWGRSTSTCSPSNSLSLSCPGLKLKLIGKQWINSLQ
jgi:hypothetical protein